MLSGIAVLLIERVGGRGLTLASTFSQFACFLIISSLLRYPDSSAQGKEYASASVAFFFLYFGSFGIGMLRIPCLYPTTPYR
jgi:hypothetical protein